ncbi:MAG: hypothetical protein K6F35_04165 [Lachnospiraceae bacterium]|nr:hypothetical protein [Lachnospiraceae bacterium]
MDISAVCEKREVLDALSREYGGEIHLYRAVLPHIFRAGDEEKLGRILEESEVLCRTLDELGFLKESGYGGEIIADAQLYACNKESAGMLSALGIAMDTAPLELSFHELMERGITGSELVIYGRVPMMVSAQCVRKNTGAGRCGRGEEKEVIFLKDRKNTEFPCLCYCRFCYNVIYNSVPVSLHGEEQRIRSLSPRRVRLSFTTEEPEEACRIAGAFLAEYREGRPMEKAPVEAFTRGHFRKGME